MSLLPSVPLGPREGLHHRVLRTLERAARHRFPQRPKETQRRSHQVRSSHPFPLLLSIYSSYSCTPRHTNLNDCSCQTTSFSPPTQCLSITFCICTISFHTVLLCSAAYRARYGVIIIGNARLLARNPLWNALLTHFQERDCLVEGISPHHTPNPSAMHSHLASHSLKLHTAYTLYFYFDLTSPYLTCALYPLQAL